MAFKDLAEVLDNTLQIPYKGKTYTIQGVSAETGRWFVALTAAGYELAVLQERARIKDAELTEDTELSSLDEDSERILREGKNRDFNREALGDALDEMEDDGLSAAQIHHIAQTVLMWTVNGREMAESYYNSGGKSASSQPGAAPNGDPDPYGRGYYDPQTGLSDYYEYPEGHGEGHSWGDILKHWALIEQDFQDAGIDLDSGVMCSRSWRWFRTRVLGLLNKPPTITKLGDGKLHQIPTTRLGLALKPPET